jgi:hypothetical protein
MRCRFETAQIEGLIAIDYVSYVISEIELTMGESPTMAPWRKRLFIATSHLTADAVDFFRLPRDRTVMWVPESRSRLAGLKPPLSGGRAQHHRRPRADLEFRPGVARA